jgi:hypothetical protein
VNQQNFSKLAAFGLALALASAGCSNGLKQDPYADQPDSVKKSAPMAPVEKAKTGDADSPLYLRIRTDKETLEFSEGSETKATINGAILSDVNGHAPVAGQDFELSLDNAADFPGVNFDPQTGAFAWTPRPGYVAENYTRNVHFDFTLTTKFAPIRRTTRSLIGVITRGEIDPTIVSVEDLTTNPAKEGDVRDFKVVVRDPHGTSKSADTKPRLAITSDQSGTASAASYIYCKGTKGCSDPAQDPNDPTKFIFTLTLDLKNKVVTSGATTLTFGLIATSRFGESSAPSSYNVRIVSGIGDAEMSWSENDPIIVIAGLQNVVNFTVYDPKGAGNLTANFDTRCTSELGADATCTCKALSSSGSSTQLCTITWKAVAGIFSSDYSISISSFNQSRFDSSIKKTVFAPRILRVVQPPALLATPPVHRKAAPVHAAATSGGHS